MRVALFGSGSPLSTAAFQAVPPHAVAAVVVPGGPSPLRGPRAFRRWLARSRAARPLASMAHGVGAPVLRFAPGGEARLAAGLASAAPDAICVATFPRLLPGPLLALAPLGAVGLHPSLLPRHRGPDPLFWTYVQDDADAGVTVHWLDAGEDSGDVLFQAAVPLARGRPVGDLYAELSRQGALLLTRALEAIAGGTAPRLPQDAGWATREPAPRPGSGGWRIDFGSWGAERVWHVLAGLGGTRALLFERDRAVPHGYALGYALERHGEAPGTLTRAACGWRVYCRDGTVDVEGAARRRPREGNAAPR